MPTTQAADRGERRTGAIRDPWDAAIEYVADRAAPLEPGCRVIVDVSHDSDDEAVWLFGRMETKAPEKAEVLEVLLLGANDESHGPLRRVERQHAARLVKTMRDI